MVCGSLKKNRPVEKRAVRVLGKWRIVVPQSKFESSYLKVERAEEIIDEIISLLSSSPPFLYVLETDLGSFQRATLAKKNGNALAKLVVRCGELFHNLRSAIDQAYYEMVSPVTPEGKEKSIQFPFSKDEVALDKTIKSRQAENAGPAFVAAIKQLKPYSSTGGNMFLTLLHEVNVTDKHKFPAPAGNFSRIDSATIQEQVLDFPGGITNGGAGMCAKDVVWRSQLFNTKDIGEQVPPFMNLYHKVLDLPVEVWFYLASPSYSGEIVSTMRELVSETKKALIAMDV